jgi:hypothetical protein
MYSQNFLPKLKKHLLPRMLSILQKEGRSIESQALHDQHDRLILLKSDRIYRHNILRINYTTYDTRRSQDVINPITSHCNVMVLNSAYGDHENSGSSHPFCYARVLGVYHVNVVYIGPGMRDYEPIRMEFIWVRWYHRVEVAQAGWGAYRLDKIQFLPMAEEEAFGFVDPLDVMRGCHIIPTFANGKLHTDGKGLSLCARDSSDWISYYVNR